MAQEHINKQQERYVDRYNRTAHRTSYEVGDLVLYRNMNRKTKVG